MDTSASTTPDKHGSETSQSLDTTHQKTDSGSATAVNCQRERRRREHNDMEKKRKEQIKACICKMGELLPPHYITSERHSTLEIVEKSLAYMRELKEARTKFSGTEESLQQEITILKTERDKFSDIIKAAGLSTETIPTNGVSSTTDVKDESPKPKNKLKKRNTLNVHLQQLQEQRDKQQQEMISSSVSVSEDASGNLQQNQLLNMPGGAFINGQNVMFNPMINQFMMPGMMGNGNQVMPNLGPMGVMGAGSGAPSMPGIGSNNVTNQTGQTANLQSDQTVNNMNKSSDDSDAGLLQLAMQDAGITPGSNSGQQSSSALTPSVSETGQEAESSSSQNNALQTLASVATSDHIFSTENNSTENQSTTAAGTGSSAMTGSAPNMPVMTSTQSGLQPMIQSANNPLMNMPMLGNPTGLSGQQQQPQQQQQQQMQQIMFINDQGIPMIANVPVGMDPNNPNVFNNSQKAGLMPGMNQTNLIKDQTGNMDQNALALAQQQANMAALQNQLLGQNAGSSIPNMPFQPQNLLQGNIIQTPNGQLLQQIGPQINGQGQLIGMPGQGQGLVVAGQQGQLTLNTMPSQPNQLPSALILPNGQIIPVVTNPGNVVSQPGINFSQGQLTQQRMSGPQIQTGIDGQILSGPSSQGLLIPAASVGQVVTSSTAASLSTSVVPTSAIQSVMTTQIQGSSVQTQKPISSSLAGPLPNVSNSNQPKIVSIPSGAPNIGNGGLAANGKASGTPILLSLPINGQPTTVLLDPVTMQVLGTVQPGQQPVPQQAAAPVSGVPTTAAPTASTAGTSGVAANKNKNKNNANQRAICPKPLGGDGFRSQSAPAKKKRPPSKAASKSKETAQADSLSESLQIQIPESTTDPEVSSAVSSESTDILAKAAESIFSPPAGDVTGVGGAFYNPANEDNPLHIDTSATEVDDELKSPSKQSKKLSNVSVSNTGTLEDNVLGLNSVAEGAKAINVSKVVNSAEKCETSTDNVTSLSVTLEEIAGMQFSESVTSVPDKNNDIMLVSEANKGNKKNKNSSSKGENKKEIDTKSGNKSSSKNKSSKKVAPDKGNVLELEKTDSDSQMDIESTLIHIPDNITFSENDLSDVLDQVEQLGNPISDNINKGQVSSKKSKSKRSKAPDPEGEPNSKKRKSGKDVKDGSKSGTPAKEILSMPSSLSVYDFDDSDDIVPSILPLNGKDFTALSSTPTKTEFGVTDSEDSQKCETKSQKSSAQNKTKKSSKSAKSSKDGDTNSQKAVCDDSASSLLLEMKDLGDIDKKTYHDNKENKSDSQSKVSAPLPSMPEIDTTTSLFGFPVPKKRPDASSRPQTNQKPVTQVSPKSSSQSNTPLVSPKQAMTSPKTTPGMVSPLHNSFSPELVSPKLSIVSPIQGLLPDNDSGTSSPKHYTEMSPIKKRTTPEKLDSMKVSSFSALNSVPLSNTSTDVFTPMDSSKPLLSSASSQSMGVITTAKTVSTSIPEPNKLSKDSKASNDTNTLMKKNVSENVQNLPVSTPSNTVQKSQNNGRNSTSMESKFNSANVPASNANNMPVPAQRPSQTSINSSQNNRYGGQFNNDPIYGSLSGMNNRTVSKDTSARSNTGINNFPVPYSADSLFSSHAEKVIKSPPNVNISTLNQKPDTSNMSKLRNTNNPYSVDSFVQSSREEGIRSRPDTIGNHSDLISNNDLGNSTNDFSRLQSESSPDGFNFANIGLNLQPITSNIPSSFMDTSSTVTSNMSSSFSFSLSSTSTTVTTSSGALGHHQFPFFPPVLSSSSNVPSSQTSLPASMSNMDIFDQNNTGNNNVIQRNNTVMHPSGTNLQRGDNSHISRVDSNNVPRGESMQRNDKGPPIRADENNRDQGISSCSKQKMPKGQGPATIQEPFSSFPNTSGGPENNFFHDSQMKSNVGKSPTEQMRKPPPQDKMMEMNNSHSRSSSTQSSMSDKRGNTMDRSPQMMNNSQPYFQSNYTSSKSLNTPPLHHPVMMPPDERGRTMTNRSPYDTPFPPPPSSQGFNAMGPSYRFDSGPPSFSRDNSGTQPLSHTPVNTGGRKSANPPPPSQTSVVKQPQKQSAPPLVPMGGPQQPPPSQAPRPTPQSHRATTPHGNQAGATPTPSGVSQSRQSKQPSRNSKPSSSKKSKTMPFMEVDSNLSNSIFETNRSMTPFFPSMQNLSPQSRMQHEGSPFLPGNFFGPGSRFPNSNTPMPKNSDIGAPFNPLFPPRAAQNGLGLNFQPGFGMNMNPLHGNHGNTPQLTPHTAPHMANFSLNNIFSDNASQNESSLNISPIKLPHTNPMFQHQGMEHNPMQHHHQYNRGHPSVMSINSILGPNHHGFDGRMNTSMAGPFHSHGHPSFIPPLNFSMHDH